MEFLQQLLDDKKKKLLLANNFKNRFLKLWADYGTLSTDYNGRVYLNRFRLSGQGVGAIKMSRLFRQPDLHNTIADDDCVDSVDIILNFNKLIEIDEKIINDYIIDYKAQLQHKEFDKLYYRFNTTNIEEAYFLKKEFLNDDSIIYTKVDDTFLTELATLIAHRKFISYGGLFPIDSSSTSILPSRVTFIEYNKTVTFSMVSIMMDSLVDYRKAIPGPHGIIGDKYIFTLPEIRDKILSFAYKKEFGADVFSDIEQIFVFNDTYYLDIEKAKRMNGESFLKLILKALDFSANEKDSCWWQSALLGLATFVIGGIVMATGNVAGGFAIITGGMGALMDSPELQVLSAVFSLGATSLETEAFSLASVGYEEAVSLVLNVSSLYFALTTPKVTKNEDESFTADTASHLLYEAPIDIYDTIYEYEALTSVSTDLS